MPLKTWFNILFFIAFAAFTVNVATAYMKKTFVETISKKAESDTGNASGPAEEEEDGECFAKTLFFETIEIFTFKPPVTTNKDCFAEISDFYVRPFAAPPYSPPEPCNCIFSVTAALRAFRVCAAKRTITLIPAYVFI